MEFIPRHFIQNRFWILGGYLVIKIYLWLYCIYIYIYIYIFFYRSMPKKGCNFIFIIKKKLCKSWRNQIQKKNPRQNNNFENIILFLKKHVENLKFHFKIYYCWVHSLFFKYFAILFGHNWSQINFNSIRLTCVHKFFGEIRLVTSLHRNTKRLTRGWHFLRLPTANIRVTGLGIIK